LKIFSRRIAILLIVGIAICDLHSIIWKLWPQTEFIEYDLFLSKKFHLKMNVLWYMYEISNMLNKIIWCYVLTVVGAKVSSKLFFIGLTFLLYQVTQFFFYLWDRNTSFWSNIIVYCFIGIAIVEIFIPDKKMAKVIRIE